MNREDLIKKLEEHAPTTVGRVDDGEIEGCTCGWKLTYTVTRTYSEILQTELGYRRHNGHFDDYREHLLELLTGE